MRKPVGFFSYFPRFFGLVAFGLLYAFGLPEEHNQAPALLVVVIPNVAVDVVCVEVIIHIVPLLKLHPTAGDSDAAPARHLPWILLPRLSVIIQLFDFGLQTLFARDDHRAIRGLYDGRRATMDEMWGQGIGLVHMGERLD